jgi:LPXTG-motif cell wall-anchored protein
MCTASSQSGTSTSSSPGASSTTSIAPVRTTEPNSGSKAWIAGAVAGPILGLALIGAGVWLFLRRKKKAAHTPHYGVAATDSSRPPAGVGGYTDAKPQYQPAQHAYPSPVQNSTGRLLTSTDVPGAAIRLSAFLQCHSKPADGSSCARCEVRSQSGSGSSRTWWQ